MALVIPYDQAGMAEYTFAEYTSIPLYGNDNPNIVTTPEVVAASVIASADLPAYTVVGRNGSGELVPAVFGSIAPIGFTTNLVKEGATNRNIAVFRSGVFNPNKLIWDSSYDTAAKKRLAFEASQPTIFMREPLYQYA